MIITVIYIFLILLSLVCTFFAYRTVLKINFIYTCLWCFGGIVVANNMFGLYSVDDIVHWCIIASVIVFNVIFLIKPRRKKGALIPNWELSANKYKILVLLNCISYIFMIPIVCNAISVMNTDGWSALREYAYATDGVVMSKSQLFVFSWIIHPVFSVTMLVAAIMAFSDYKNKKIILCMAIIDVILMTVSFGGRNNIIKFVAFFAIAFFLKMKYTNKKITIPKKYVVLVALVLVLLAYLTSMRSLGGLSFFGNIVIYLYGSIVYFGKLITDGLLPQMLLYGKATLGIITSIPSYIMYNITGNNLTPEFLLDSNTEAFINISDTYRYNALATWFYPFWADAKMVGVVIGTIFIATLYRFVSSKLEKTNSMVLYAFKIYIIYVILMSTMTYRLMNIQETVFLLLLVIITRRARVIARNEGQEIK